MPEDFDWVALWALVVAGLALIVAVAAATFSKIQADAAVGNVAPDFEMTGQRMNGGGMARGLDINVWNHNRQTIHIQNFSFKAPKSLDIMHQPTPGGAFSAPSRKTKLKFEMPIKNIDRNKGMPSQFHFAHNAKKGQEIPEEFYITCRVRYRVGGSLFPRWENCALQVFR